MALRRPRNASSLAVQNDEPLIGLILEQDGLEVVHYFASDEDAELAISSDSRQVALGLAGAWKDLDWETMAEALDKIRHESPPSAPLSL